MSVALSPASALAQSPDAYKQHMDNGVKLFADKNYEAALIEFRAAYDARPRANPLVNIALCHKALFSYPKAIVALEAAISKHRDTMDAADQKAAEAAITEMKGLLGRVTVTLSPPHATLIIDGEEQPPGTADKPIALGPGPHKIGAQADGFGPVEQSVRIASGDTKQIIKLALIADKGWVTIRADAGLTISIDQRVVGIGSWAGTLAPGAHIVQISGAGGRIFSTQQVLVVAGKHVDVRPGAAYPVEGNGQGAIVGTPDAPKKEDPPTPPKRGVYVIGTASLLFPTQHPVTFPKPEINSGAAGGLRVGYRVNTAAAFDVMFEHSSLYTGSDDAKYREEGSYTLKSTKVGLDLRLMTPGRLVRLVGSVGGGIVYDRVSFRGVDKVCSKCRDSSGIDPFMLAEIGIELDLSNVLLGLAFQSQFQSSRGIDGESDTDQPFGTKPLVHVGPSLRVGYAFW